MCILTASQNMTCDPACSEHGCWGPGPDKCLKCKSLQLMPEQICLRSCNALPMLFETENRTCEHCHEQCAQGCSGPVSLVYLQLSVLPPFVDKETVI